MTNVLEPLAVLISVLNLAVSDSMHCAGGWACAALFAIASMCAKQEVRDD